MGSKATKTDIEEATFEDYFLSVEQIGHGGFGKVYKYKNLNIARSLEKYNISDEYIAVKVIPLDKFLFKEIEILATVATLKGPWNLKYYGHFNDSCNWYIITEYIEGEDLYNFINRHTLLNRKQTDTIIRLIFNGLKGLHAEGIAHRDIKIENIMIIHKNDVITGIKFIDYGFACSSKTAFLGIKNYKVGTPLYIDPLIVYKANRFMPLFYTDLCMSDWYSFGIVWLIMLTHKIGLEHIDKIEEDQRKNIIKGFLTLNVASRKSAICLMENYILDI